MGIVLSIVLSGPLIEELNQKTAKSTILEDEFRTPASNSTEDLESAQS